MFRLKDPSIPNDILARIDIHGSQIIAAAR